MIILGLNAFHGDSAAAIVRNDALIAAMKLGKILDPREATRSLAGALTTGAGAPRDS
jgi:predicted NodU family carbamoyl transferase